MAGGGIVAGGVALLIVGLILPGVGAQQTLVQVGQYQVTQTTYPYAGLGQALVILGIIMLPIGFIVMAVSSAHKRREERERAEERQQLFDLATRPATFAYVPPPPVVPPAQTAPPPPPASAAYRSFCPTCGQHLNSDFCPDDGMKTKSLGGEAL